MGKPTATQLFRMRLSRFLAENPDVRPSPLGVAAGQSDSYVRRLLTNPDQSPKLETAERIAQQIGMTLVEMISEPSAEELRNEFTSLFSRLDDQGKRRALASIRADIEHLEALHKDD